jgi:hypothetical protein
MVRKVMHLVVVTEIDGQPARPSVHRRRAGAAGGGKSA